MDVFKMILSLIYLAVCVLLVVVVLLQDAQEAGLSGSIGGSAETFFGQNRDRSPQATKKRLTAILAGLFILLSLVLGYMILNVK